MKPHEFTRCSLNAHYEPFAKVLWRLCRSLVPHCVFQRIRVRMEVMAVTSTQFVRLHKVHTSARAKRALKETGNTAKVTCTFVALFVLHDASRCPTLTVTMDSRVWRWLMILTFFPHFFLTISNTDVLVSDADIIWYLPIPISAFMESRHDGQFLLLMSRMMSSVTDKLFHHQPPTTKTPVLKHAHHWLLLANLVWWHHQA